MLRICYFFMGIVLMLAGVYLWTFPAATLVAYSLYLGISYISSSIAVFLFLMVKKIKPVPYGDLLISFIIGSTILALPLLSLRVILWIFVFGFLASAIYYLTRVLSEKQNFHLLQLALAILAVAYAFIMLFNPIVAGNTMAKIIAAFVILNGASYVALSLNKNLKKTEIQEN